MIKKYVSDLFIGNRWYIFICICIFLFLTAFFVPFIWNLAMISLLVLAVLTIADYLLLFFGRRSISAARIMKEYMNLGHGNTIQIDIRNNYPFTASITLIDELPVQFQERKFKKKAHLIPGRSQIISYELRPLSRGNYHFGQIICYAQSPIGFLQRRLRQALPQSVKVYPSTKYFRHYQLLALSDNSMTGSKKLRRLGHSLEFEQIKEYVQGDDIRSINWKATARKGGLMVNHYVDTRSQQVYCIIDKGRAMKMPFDGMTLLDYAINAALVFLNVALLKQDRAGLFTFSSGMHDIIPAERNGKQLGKIQEVLYGQSTDFGDSNYEAMATVIYRKLSHRSLLLLFTNFETFTSLERQLPYLRKMASRHLVCVVLFRNILLKQIHESQPDTLEGIYIKTIADRFDFEKKQIAKELRRHGILSILTTPEELTLDVVNKYLEIKSRQMI